VTTTLSTSDRPSTVSTETPDRPEKEVGITEPRRVDGIVVGRLVAFDDTGRPRVRLSGALLNDALVARSATPLSVENIGREVAILCEEGDPTRPMIIGLMHDALKEAPGPEPELGDLGELEKDLDLDLTANRQITLRCGKASITLTRAGKIILRGTYLFSRSSGVNKIKGGSVQLN